MEDIFDNELELQEEQTDTQTTENVVELTDELAENHESETESVQDTEKSTQDKEKPKEDKLNPYEKVILAEMERRAKGEDGDMPDDNLAKGLADKGKDIHKCYEYVKAQAKKKAVNGCAMIEDAVVFGWAHHYYIEPKEVIDAELKPKSAPKTDTRPTTPAKGAEKPKKPVNPKDAGKNNPLLQKVGKGKKNAKQGNDKVYTKRVNGKTFTITEFLLF